MSNWVRECIADFDGVVGSGLELELVLPKGWAMWLEDRDIVTMTFEGVHIATNQTPFIVRYGDLIIRTRNEIQGDVTDTDGALVSYYAKKYSNADVRKYQLRVDGKDDYFE